jgi:hypothetical protein
VPILSPIGKPLDDYFSHAMHTPPSRTPRMPLFSLPLTPDASPCDWDRDASRSSTPPGCVSATHPEGVPLYGLGFSPSLFDEELQVISIGSRLDRGVDGLPDAPNVPTLLPPPSITRPKRTASPRPEYAPSSPSSFILFSPGPTTLRERRKRTQRRRNIAWGVISVWTIFFLYQKITGSSLLWTWMKHNARWSAQLSQFTGDSMYGLEEDFTPSTPVFFHRTQRHEYNQYVQEATVSLLKETVSGDIHQNENPYSSDAALEHAAISERIDDMLSWPELGAYLAGRGNTRQLYHEALLAVNDFDPIINLGADELLSLLQQTDVRRQRFLEAVTRLIRAGQLPSGWRNPSTMDSLVHRIWTQSSNDFSDLFGADSVERAIDWNEDSWSAGDVVVFTRVSRAVDD